MEPVDPLPAKPELENDRVDCSINIKTLSREQLLDEQQKIEDELAEIYASQMLQRKKRSSSCCGSRSNRTSSGLP